MPLSFADSSEFRAHRRPGGVLAVTILWPIAAALYIASWLLIPHVLLAKKRPASTLAWIWAILLFPFVGALIYIFIGSERMTRKRLRRAKKLNLTRHSGHPGVFEKIERESPGTAAMLRALANINEIPPSTVTDVRLLVDACDFYPALKARIAEAQHHVHIEFFIWRADDRGREFLEALVAAARRGVEVRLLLDQIGCLGVRRSFFQPLIDAGGRFSWFYSLPFGRHSRFMNLRNHRKLQIIDGRVAFVGGMNIGREYACEDETIGLWRDAQIEVIGNVVTHLQEVFATDWFFASEERISGKEYFREPAVEHGAHLCQVIAGGPDLPREPIPKSLISLLNFASKRVWIATGYFAPDILLLNALQICAARGVEVRLLISEKTDHPYLVQVGRSYYEDLLRYGVRVFEYSKGINHAKVMLVDDDWVMVGSANSDNRSLRLNFELNLLVHDAASSAQFEKVMRKEFAESAEITLKDFAARPLSRRLLEAALRPLAPLL
jgi:cardiolipin synthase